MVRGVRNPWRVFRIPCLGIAETLSGYSGNRTGVLPEPERGIGVGKMRLVCGLGIGCRGLSGV